MPFASVAESVPFGAAEEVEAAFGSALGRNCDSGGDEAGCVDSVIVVVCANGEWFGLSMDPFVGYPDTKCGLRIA